MGHGDLACPIPAQRNALGKLPYDIAMRAPEDRKKKLQNLSQAAAAESFGHTSCTTFRQQSRPASQEGNRASSASEMKGTEHDEREVQSPLKRKEPEKEAGRGKDTAHARQ